MIIEYVFLFFACVGALITVGIAFLLHLHFFWLKHLFEEPDRTMAWVKIVFLLLVPGAAHQPAPFLQHPPYLFGFPVRLCKFETVKIKAIVPAHEPG